MFDSPNLACYSDRTCAVPAAQNRKFLFAEGCLRIPVYALALSAQAAQPEAGSGQLSSSTDIVQLLLDAPWFSKGVLLILLLFSAVSWGIILYKMWAFRRAERQTASFLAVFRKSSKFSEVQAVCSSLDHSPLVGLFQAGYAELNAQLRQSQTQTSDGPKPAANPGRPTLKSLDAVDRALLRASAVELAKLERRLSFLATTASITPFIGLFGTVWGIMTSFQRIGAAGSSSLGVVAPGIADALIATAAGLFAAIPAVYFYNSLTGGVKEFATAMDDFSLEFLNICERNFT
jgi:biopolymer transport protein TolQ